MSEKELPRPEINAAKNPQAAAPEQEQVRINGFAQVLEMLKIADPAFRESLLKRLAAKDRNLARQLREDLENFGLL